MDWEKEVSELSKAVESRGVEICNESKTVATEALEEVDARFGEKSDNPLPYHNATHALDVMKRSFRITNAVLPYIYKPYQCKIYDLALIGSATHDIERGQEKSLDEKLSADFAVNMIRSRGHSPINQSKFISRLRDGILATKVTRRPDGNIQQVNLRKGSRDPFKLILATADINGIAMEGPKRMTRDAINLCYELHQGNPTSEELLDFILSQRAFLKERLSDKQIKPDLEYYFKDSSKEVYELGRNEFHGTIDDAYSVAIKLANLPLVRNSIDSALSVVDKTPGATRIQNALARALRI